MAKSREIKMNLPSADDLFTTQEERNLKDQEYVKEISIYEITDFPNHPFKVQMDDKMVETVESVRDHGVLVPVLVRTKPERTVENNQTVKYNLDNNQKRQNERNEDNEKDQLQPTGRLSSAQSCSSSGRGSSPWEVRVSQKRISDEEKIRDVPEPVNIREIESAFTSDGGRSISENGNTSL